MFRIFLSLVLFGVILWIGIVILRMLARPVPPPPLPGEMRRVNLRFRCEICGTEVKMVQANDEIPVPPRHCQDDMSLVAPIYE